jgi:enamine deaminase RidA (YjgF/YER057c/UK114 family)
MSSRAFLVVRFAALFTGACVSHLITAAEAKAPPPEIQRLPAKGRPGTAASVRVADVPLVFTGQIFAATAGGDAATQARDALRALGDALVKTGSSLDRVVRLSAYAADDAAVTTIEAAVGVQFSANPPALTVVRTPLQVARARVAFEAVATTARSPSAVESVGSSAAILPAGGKIFISGQAERAPDQAGAVKATMAGLHRSVAHLGLKKSDIVQVKGFLKAMDAHEAAVREVVASFDGQPAPPVVLYEWVSDLFTEIEIVVSAKSLNAVANDNITYAWLPWLTKSPRYCHVANVMPGTPLIFVSAVDGGDASDPRTQMKTIFERLGSTLFEAGSSYRNLAKATYYLADPTARTLLGDLRGVYFDPTRPPAASALNMHGLGYRGRAAMFDIVAVPVK